MMATTKDQRSEGQGLFGGLFENCCSGERSGSDAQEIFMQNPNEQIRSIFNVSGSVPNTTEYIVYSIFITYLT